MRVFSHQDDARKRSLWLTLAFALCIALLIVVVNLGMLTLMFLWPPNWGGGPLQLPEYFFTLNTGAVLLYVFGSWALESSVLREGGVALAKRAGARPLNLGDSKHEREQQLHNIAQELAISANMRAPQLMLLVRQRGINAFAAGWDEKDSVVAVTEGALDTLSREELSGLLAHEMSHIREGDTRLNMRLAGMVGGLEMLYNLGQSMTAEQESGGRGLLAIPGMVVLGTGWLGHLAGAWLKSLVLHQREFLADARAVQWTRSKEGLGRTLRKALWQSEELGLASTRLHPLVAHMQLTSDADDDFASRRFASHPDLNERIERIYGEPMEALEAKELANTYRYMS
jgi:heat shock protein HtpX